MCLHYIFAHCRLIDCWTEEFPNPENFANLEVLKYVYTKHTAVYSPAKLRHVGPASLQHRFFLMWERKEAKCFDVTTGHTQTMHSCHALDYSWGEHCTMVSLRYDCFLLYSVHESEIH